MNLISGNPLDSFTKVFEIKKDGGKTTLYYPDLNYTYYDNKEAADKIIAEKKAKEKAEQEAAAAAELEELKTNIVGVWETVGFCSKDEFTADGKYKFTNYKENIWQYETIDSQTLRITKDTGETYNERIKLHKTDTGYELSFSNFRHVKSSQQP